MEKFREVVRVLKKRGVEIRKIRATLNGAQAYKIIGSEEHNPAAIWTAWDIKYRYQRGEFA